MWARIKGRTENALLRLPFKAAYMFRPGIIQPVHGARSRTTVYRVAYTILGPVIPLLRRLFPRYILTTEEVGQAMIQVARQGWPRKVLEIGDIHDCAAAYRASAAETKC
jgi:cytochrome c oxidase assembly factor CtaG